MELTNHSFLETKRNYLSAYSARKIASDRISNGSRLQSDKHDLGAIGVSAKLNTSRIQDFAEKTNLQNFHTFLQSQSDGLEQARRIYERMDQLAINALDPTLGDSSTPGSDLKSLDREFQELAESLDVILNQKVNGQRLFGGTSADFTDGLMDETATRATPQIVTIDVGTTKGKMTIELSSGGAADQIWMFQGELPSELNEYFDSDTYDNSGDNEPADLARLDELNGKLSSLFDKQGIFTTGPWATFGNSSAGNFDKFEVEFNTCEVEVTPTFDPSNESYVDPIDGSISLGEGLYNDLIGNGTLRKNVPPGDSTKITMIGVNSGNTHTYEVSAKFEPDLPVNDFVIPGSSDLYPAISFGNIDCSNINTKEKAQSVLSSISAELNNLTDSIASIAAFQSRTEKEIEHLSASEVTYEAATGRIEDTDFAKEATSLAKNSIKTEMAAHMLSKSARLKDVLVPLTTEHFRSHVLKSTL